MRDLAELLGPPAEQREWLQEASRVVGSMVEPFAALDAALINARYAQLDGYFLAIIEERRQFPGDDIISALASKDDEPVLDADEIVAMIVFFLSAGHETVTGMLGNALVAFAAFPQQRAMLRDNPALTANAVEKLLRFDRPDPKPRSFGFGTHQCLGAALARMEVRTAMPALLERLGNYTVDTERIV
jgi:cytochrome P450